MHAHLGLVLIVTPYLILTLHTFIVLAQFLYGTLDLACSEETLSGSLCALIWNCCLIVLWCGSHSLLKFIRGTRVNERGHGQRANWGHYGGLVYGSIANGAILILCHKWIRTPHLIVLNAWIPPPLPTAAIGFVHGLAWYLVISSSIMLDLGSALGLKLAYYAWYRLDTFGEKDPAFGAFLERRSHGSFIGFILLFWCQDVMTLDRLILACLVSLWMYRSWCPTKQDMMYQELMLAGKRKQWTNKRF